MAIKISCRQNARSAKMKRQQDFARDHRSKTASERKSVTERQIARERDARDDRGRSRTPQEVQPMHVHPPEKLPDPWLFDSAALLKELDRVRELILAIPLRNDTFGPTN